MSAPERIKDEQILLLYAPTGADITRLIGYVVEHSVQK
jgi:hypothetical protein